MSKTPCFAVLFEGRRLNLEGVNLHPLNLRGVGSQGLGSVANVPVASQTAVGKHFPRKIGKESQPVAIIHRKEKSIPEDTFLTN